jgi:hypothetical protein
MKFSEYKTADEKYGLGSDWMTLKEGDNKIRIVSEFEDYGSHYNLETKKSVICIGKDKCPLCQEGDNPRVQFLGWVIDRSDGRVKLLRIGYKIFQQIGDFAKSEEYAFDTVPDYDITIKRTGQGLDTVYSVLPARQNTPLTDKEKEMIMEKVKPVKNIIDSMKAKVVPSLDIPDEEIPVIEDEEPEEEIPL